MRIELEKNIAAPVETVFALATDFATMDKRISGVVRVEMLTEGPVGVGTRFSETRVMFGKEHAETMEVTAFEKNKRVGLLAGGCGCRYDSGFEFEPTESGTRVKLFIVATPQTLMARLMTPVGWLVKPTMRKMIEQDLEDLRIACEGKQAEAAPA